MKVDILTVLPELFAGPFSSGMIRQAIDQGLAAIRVRDLRDFCEDRHRTTDDYAYGGGPGMVLKPGPIFRAVETVRQAHTRVLLMTPQGKTFTQAMAEDLSSQQHLVLICGRYEGVDERVRQSLVTDEVSIGDYVLTGGEFPAMVVVDAVLRLLPGVLKSEVPRQDSFASGLLEGPQYTRPASFRGMEVPELLMSGHHQRVERWRKKQALRVTLERRPDLLRSARLEPDDLALLQEIREELGVTGEEPAR